MTELTSGVRFDDDGNLWVPRFYSIAEVAMLLGLHRTTVWGQVTRRGLGRRFGHAFVLTAEDIEVVRQHVRSHRARKEGTP